MDLSEGLCLGTASLKRDTAFVRLRKPYSDSAELVEALVHAGVVSRIGPSTLRVPAVVLVLVLGGPGGCRLCRTHDPPRVQIAHETDQVVLRERVTASLDRPVVEQPPTNAARRFVRAARLVLAAHLGGERNQHPCAALLEGGTFHVGSLESLGLIVPAPPQSPSSS